MHDIFVVSKLHNKGQKKGQVQANAVNGRFERLVTIRLQSRKWIVFPFKKKEKKIGIRTDNYQIYQWQYKIYDRNKGERSRETEYFKLKESAQPELHTQKSVYSFAHLSALWTLCQIMRIWSRNTEDLAEVVTMKILLNKF